jgi:voltage-gated sodium channel
MRQRIPATCARIADSDTFNYAIFGVILANAVVLGLETYDSISRDAGGLLETLNDVFLGVFVVELAIRLVGFGLARRTSSSRAGTCSTSWW